MEKYYILTNETNERAFEISESAYRELFQLMDNEKNIQRAFHIVQGEETLKDLFPNTRIYD